MAINELKISSHFITLKTDTGLPLANQEIGAFEARPTDLSEVKAGLIVIQEIFGVNHHVQEVAKNYARLGYWVIAPAYFDHVKKNVELGYDDKDMQEGFKLMQEIGFPQFEADTKIAGLALQKKLSELPGTPPKIGVVGYCLGGSLAWAVSCHTNGIFSAASAYYGSQVIQTVDDQPKNPIIFHFGKQDHHIPLEKVSAFQKAHPDLSVYLYDADHGFNNNDKKSFNAPSAELALERTLSFFNTHLRNIR